MVGWNKTDIVVEDPYPTGELYIIDGRDRNVPLPLMRNGKVFRTTHEAKVDRMYHLFATHTNFNITDVRFPHGSTADDWTQYWDQELNKHPEDTLIIIYFHGGAGYEDDNYSFAVPGFPGKSEVNAFELIEIANKSKSDSIFLLDCYIQTRFTTKWVNKENNVEVSARSPRMQTPQGNIIPHKGDFTESIVRNLKDYAKGLSRKYAGHKALKSIPEIMKDDADMYSNPLRPVWFDRTRYKDEKPVARGKVSPQLSRAAGIAQLVFVKEWIQGEGEVKWPKPTNDQIEKARAEERGDRICNECKQLIARPVGSITPVEDAESLDDDDEDEGIDMEGVQGNEAGGLFVSEDDSDFD
ncbi:hypothetical protein LTR56_003346 [Elasticomyces elasticus]|nr:hypothetical protein LTR56_003346 [Elasticomyces elasticus]KAK3664236.1 hypothetical protein LTR22_004934 [Elasticomyces elasticus]KAK4931452.1 hypothetical protein LTR49_002153 [Elasticomyces elasticus]KAK5766029.1 hypothetical protein LTS12_003775 [Elasticomyces elasticus]